MNVAYVLYREDIYSPLVESQVFGNLFRIAKNSDVQVHFIWLKRIDYYFKHLEEINITKQKLADNNIILHEIPIIVGKFPINKAMTEFVKTQVCLTIRRIIRKNNIHIIHTRGYNAGLLIANMYANDPDVHHVFDPRSPYLTELISTYHVQEETDIHNYWKKNEEYIVRTADVTIAISDSFGRYLQQLGGHIVVIPNNSEMEQVDAVLKRVKAQRRNSLCFVGSLGYGWNNVLQYMDFVKQVWEIDPSIFLELYVLKADIVIEEFQKAGIDKSRYLIKTLPQSEVGKTISGCIAGLQIMAMKDTRLGIKTVDYLSAGVPVICNNNAVGAAELVNQYGVGWNVDFLNLKEVLQQATQNRESMECKCANLAYDHYSTDVTARKYYEIYKKVLKKSDSNE